MQGPGDGGNQSDTGIARPVLATASPVSGFGRGREMREDEMISLEPSGYKSWRHKVVHTYCDPSITKKQAFTTDLGCETCS